MALRITLGDHVLGEQDYGSDGWRLERQPRGSPQISAKRDAGGRMIMRVLRETAGILHDVLNVAHDG